MQPYDELVAELIELARSAGSAILDIYAGDFAVDTKPDRSPVTVADLTANRIIVEGLQKLDNTIPVISEESDLPTFRERSQWMRYWLVDPLDGTREFVNRNGEFTVNIALIEATAPRLGVVYAPVRDVVYTGCRGSGAARIEAGSSVPIQAAVRSHQPLKVLGSRSHRGRSLDRWIDALGDHEFLPMGSSLKFCLIAEGTADVYPRFGPTSEWDTAAAQAVAEAAGARVLKLDATPLDYNTKADMLNPHFIVSGPADRNWYDPAAGAPD